MKKFKLAIVLSLPASAIAVTGCSTTKGDSKNLSVDTLNHSEEWKSGYTDGEWGNISFSIKFNLQIIKVEVSTYSGQDAPHPWYITNNIIFNYPFTAGWGPGNDEYYFYLQVTSIKNDGDMIKITISDFTNQGGLEVSFKDHLTQWE